MEYCHGLVCLLWPRNLNDNFKSHACMHSTLKSCSVQNFVFKSCTKVNYCKSCTEFVCSKVVQKLIIAKTVQNFVYKLHVQNLYKCYM